MKVLLIDANEAMVRCWKRWLRNITTVESVSYTHLDVYKRQMPKIRFMNLGALKLQAFYKKLEVLNKPP